MDKRAQRGVKCLTFQTIQSSRDKQVLLNDSSNLILCMGAKEKDFTRPASFLNRLIRSLKLNLERIVAMKTQKMNGKEALLKVPRSELSAASHKFHLENKRNGH